MYFIIFLHINNIDTNKLSLSYNREYKNIGNLYKAIHVVNLVRKDIDKLLDELKNSSILLKNKSIEMGTQEEYNIRLPLYDKEIQKLNIITQLISELSRILKLAISRQQEMTEINLGKMNESNVYYSDEQRRNKNFVQNGIKIVELVLKIHKCIFHALYIKNQEIYNYNIQNTYKTVYHGLSSSSNHQQNTLLPPMRPPSLPLPPQPKHQFSKKTESVDENTFYRRDENNNNNSSFVYEDENGFDNQKHNSYSSKRNRNFVLCPKDNNNKSSSFYSNRLLDSKNLNTSASSLYSENKENLYSNANDNNNLMFRFNSFKNVGDIVSQENILFNSFINTKNDEFSNIIKMISQPIENLIAISKSKNDFDSTVHEKLVNQYEKVIIQFNKWFNSFGKINS